MKRIHLYPLLSLFLLGFSIQACSSKNEGSQEEDSQLSGDSNQEEDSQDPNDTSPESDSQDPNDTSPESDSQEEDPGDTKEEDKDGAEEDSETPEDDTIANDNDVDDEGELPYSCPSPLDFNTNDYLLVFYNDIENLNDIGIEFNDSQSFFSLFLGPYSTEEDENLPKSGDEIQIRSQNPDPYACDNCLLITRGNLNYIATHANIEIKAIDLENEEISLKLTEITAKAYQWDNASDSYIFSQSGFSLCLPELIVQNSN